MLLAASHGFAIDKIQLQALAGQVASEQGRPFEKGVPCDVWVRSFCSRLREKLTFRAHEEKDAA